MGCENGLSGLTGRRIHVIINNCINIAKLPEWAPEARDSEIICRVG